MNALDIAQEKHLIEVFADLHAAYGLDACVNALVHVVVHQVLPMPQFHRSTGADSIEREMQQWLDTPPGPL